MIELLTELNMRLRENSVKSSEGLQSDLSIRDFIAKETKFYGELVVKNVREKIGQIFPNLKVTKTLIEKNKHENLQINSELEVVAYIWARTVYSPNPKYSHREVPLISSFQVCKKQNKEKWINYKLKNSTYQMYISDSSESEYNSTISRKGGVWFILWYSNTFQVYSK